MSDPGHSNSAVPPEPEDSEPTLDEFDKAFGESFAHTIDLNTWRSGEGLLENMGRIEQEVAVAITREERYSAEIRHTLFPLLGDLGGIPEAGVWRASPKAIDQVHRGILFNGAIEASNGLSLVHDTLPLSITQIGVCLVSYDGAHGNWAHRLFRRDLREEVSDPVGDLERLLRRRQRRDNGRMGSDLLSDLARRGMMAYAERSVLQLQSQARWRMGHGSPIPMELLSGLWTAQRDMVRTVIDLVQWFADHERFLFVPSRPRRRDYLMLGNALKGGEYAIIGTMEHDLRELVRRRHYRDEYGVRREVEALVHDIAPNFVVGVYRASDIAPPYVFHAHRKQAHLAAHIALADAQLQEMRGFPMLLDLALQVCRSTFGLDSLTPMVQTAYAAGDEPLRYMEL